MPTSNIFASGRQCEQALTQQTTSEQQGRIQGFRKGGEFFAEIAPSQRGEFGPQNWGDDGGGGGIHTWTRYAGV